MVFMSQAPHQSRFQKVVVQGFLVIWSVSLCSSCTLVICEVLKAENPPPQYVTDCFAHIHRSVTCCYIIQLSSHLIGQWVMLSMWCSQPHCPNSAPTTAYIHRRCQPSQFRQDMSRLACRCPAVPLSLQNVLL